MALSRPSRRWQVTVERPVVRPLVSVITPTYNHARFLGRCLESLLAQTYAHWDLVIVDDGSTDETGEVVRAYPDPRIRYVRQEHRGVRALATTINSGLARTTGELVTMLASDDTWPPHRLERQIQVFRDPNVVLCFGRGLLIDEQDHVLGEVRPPAEMDRVSNRPPGTVLHEMFLSNFIPQYTVLLRRSALERIGGYLQPEGLLGEDYPTHMALALIGEFCYLDIPLGNYRMHAAQMTRNHYLEMSLTDITYVLRFFRRLDGEMQARSGWTEETLSAELAKRITNSYCEVGRRALLARDWSHARRHFVAALQGAPPRTKAKALLGLGCSLLHTDMERVARWAGHTPLR